MGSLLESSTGLDLDLSQSTYHESPTHHHTNTYCLEAVLSDSPFTVLRLGLVMVMSSSIRTKQLNFNKSRGRGLNLLGGAVKSA